MNKTITAEPTPWTTVLIVCRKCSRRIGGGYGPDKRSSLRSALNDELRDRGQRRSVRVMESKCFGICPKKAVVALNASRPEKLLIVPRGAPASTALEELGEAPT